MIKECVTCKRAWEFGETKYFELNTIGLTEPEKDFMKIPTTPMKIEIFCSIKCIVKHFDTKETV